VGEALQEYNLVYVFKNQVDCCKKMFIETKKLETQTIMREMNKKRIKKQQQTTRQCKPNNVGNELDISGLLQKHVYKNKKKIRNLNNKREMNK